MPSVRLDPKGKNKQQTVAYSLKKEDADEMMHGDGEPLIGPKLPPEFEVGWRVRCRARASLRILEEGEQGTLVHSAGHGRSREQRNAQRFKSNAGKRVDELVSNTLLLVSRRNSCSQESRLHQRDASPAIDRRARNPKATSRASTHSNAYHAVTGHICKLTSALDSSHPHPLITSRRWVRSSWQRLVLP